MRALQEQLERPWKSFACPWIGKYCLKWFEDNICPPNAGGKAENLTQGQEKTFKENKQIKFFKNLCNNYSNTREVSNKLVMKFGFDSKQKKSFDISTEIRF